MPDTQQKFPCKRWRLLPSFKPVEVEIVGIDMGWRHRRSPIDSKGKRYSRDGVDLFKTKDEAIAHGRTVLAAQQKIMDTRQAAIDKKRAALDAAEQPE